MNINILPDGDLELALEEGERQWILDQLASDKSAAERAWGPPDELSMLGSLTEPYWANGGFEPFDAGQANPFVGLTTAPCIAESMNVADDGEMEIVIDPNLPPSPDGEARFWYYTNYMTRSFIDDLVESGRTVFTLAR
jgi:hypothetical protein